MLSRGTGTTKVPPETRTLWVCLQQTCIKMFPTLRHGLEPWLEMAREHRTHGPVPGNNLPMDLRCCSHCSRTARRVTCAAAARNSPSNRCLARMVAKNVIVSAALQRDGAGNPFLHLLAVHVELRHADLAFEPLTVGYDSVERHTHRSRRHQ